MTPEECKQIFALLSEYLDGELPPGVCENLERHIGECPPCVEFVKSLRKSTELCRRLKAASPSEPLPDDALADLRAAWQRTLTAASPDA